MTWLVEWIGKHVGSWLGATEPEPIGSMRAALRGSSSVGGKLTAELTPSPVVELHGGGYAKPHGPEALVVKNDNDVILATVVAFVLAQE